MLLINRVCNRAKTDNYSELRFNRISIKKCPYFFPTATFCMKCIRIESFMPEYSHSWRHHSFLVAEQWRFSSPSFFRCRKFFFFFSTSFFSHTSPVDDWVLMERRLDGKLFSFHSHFAIVIDFWWRNFRIVASVCDITFFSFSYFWFFFLLSLTSLFTSFANILLLFSIY